MGNNGGSGTLVNDPPAQAVVPSLVDIGSNGNCPNPIYNVYAPIVMIQIIILYGYRKRIYNFAIVGAKRRSCKGIYEDGFNGIVPFPDCLLI